MTMGSDLVDAGIEMMLASLGVSVTYTEAGVAGQAVSAIEIKRKTQGDKDLSRDFIFRRSTLTITAEAWRGAQITGADSKVFHIESRRETPGTVTFTAVRPLVRS